MYYTSECDESQNFIVVVEDNYGQSYEFEIDLSHIAFKILPGYALRLELCGQHFPAYERNANSGGPLLQDTELFLSRHTIYHDAEHPAVLTLPCW